MIKSQVMAIQTRYNFDENEQQYPPLGAICPSCILVTAFNLNELEIKELFKIVPTYTTSDFWISHWWWRFYIKTNLVLSILVWSLYRIESWTILSERLAEK
jgi:hypothetical protein